MSERPGDWYPIECEHGFDLCPTCDAGLLPDDVMDARGNLRDNRGNAVMTDLDLVVTDAISTKERWNTDE